MSTLIVEVLETEISQPWEFYLRKPNLVVGFYPYLYIQNAPAGTFTWSIEKSGQTVFSKSFTSADLKASLATINDHLHVWFPILPVTAMILGKGSYLTRLTATGYSATSTSFIGWIRQHENVYNEMDYQPSTDLENPLSLKMKTASQGILR